MNNPWNGYVYFVTWIVALAFTHLAGSTQVKGQSLDRTSTLEQNISHVVIGSVSIEESGEDRTKDCQICVKGEASCITTTPSGGFEVPLLPGEKIISQVKCGEQIYLPKEPIKFLVDNRDKIATYLGFWTLRLKQKNENNLVELVRIEDRFFDDTITSYNSAGKAQQLQYAKAFEVDPDSSSTLRLKKVFFDEDEDTSNKLEKNYFQFGAILPFTTFGGDASYVNDRRSSFKSQSGNKSLVFGFEFGAYKPKLKHRALIGFSGRYLGYIYGGGGNEIVFQSGDLALSGYYFFNGVIGRGFYGRADLGTPWGRLYNTPSSGTASVYTSRILISGISFLMGLGYAYPVEPGMRVFGQLGLSTQSINAINNDSTIRDRQTISTKSFLITLGALF